jgi:hypothetical protein
VTEEDGDDAYSSIHTFEYVAWKKQATLTIINWNFLVDWNKMLIFALVKQKITDYV